ncbi:hypothetical protein ELI_4472 [Eubacterium callanderi]|uniref:Uncharacterized protein n=1 Tax=Eubacterium callanderi TaxID=53442 RepID=E3GQW4_9FIRM|nr:hypothetical protein ELI_4472 [Eubacterium callanderi]
MYAQKIKKDLLNFLRIIKLMFKQKKPLPEKQRFFKNLYEFSYFP